MRKTINQLHWLCRLQNLALLSPSQSSNATHSFFNVTETTDTKEPGPSSDVKHLSDETDDDDEDAYIRERNAKDHYRLCRA